MRKLNEARADILEANVIELGCGADYGLVPALLRQDKLAVGVDLDLTGLNQDLLPSEIMLRTRDISLNQGESGFSCYRFYPPEITNQLEAATFLKPQVEAAKIRDQIFAEHLGVVSTRPDLMERGRALSLPRVERDSSIENRLFEGDALQALEHGGTFSEIYASDFLHNIQLLGELQGWLDRIKSCLNKGGTLMLINDEEHFGPLLAPLVQNGFKLNEAEELSSQSEWLSLRIQGQNTNPAVVYFGAKIMATFEKI